MMEWITKQLEKLPVLGKYVAEVNKEYERYITMAKEQLGATTLMVTHDTFSASYCDRVIMMKDGSVHSELVNHGDRKAFLEDLLNVLRELNGGDDHDVA